MCEFYIKKISLTNYRGFTSTDFFLNKRMNVFIGRNGSGKTSILEAANVILGAYLSAYSKYVDSRHVFNISADDPHLISKPIVKSEAIIPSGIQQYPCAVQADVKWCGKKTDIEFQRVLAKTGARTKFAGKNPMQPDVNQWEEWLASGEDNNHGLILPVVLYLSSARLWNENPSKPFDNVPLRTDGYQRCLDDKHGINFVLEYLKTLKDFAAEERQGKDYASYEAIDNAINYAMSSELPQGAKVVFSRRYPKDILALKTDDEVLIPFKALSDGYRNVIKIVLDIAARACMLNPELKDKALEETPGIVIIDELDLSLHPEWQKRMVGILKRLFPKMQFICATHSPFIIQSLKSDELHVLDASQDIDTSICESGIEDIAEELMKVEMPQYSVDRIKMYKAAKEFFQAVNESKNASELKNLNFQLAQLEAKYSSNPAYKALMELELKKRELMVGDV